MANVQSRYPLYKLLLVAWDTYTNYFGFYLMVTVVLLVPFNLASAYFFSPTEPGPLGSALLNIVNSSSDWVSFTSTISNLTWTDLFSTNPVYWKGYAIGFLGFFAGLFHGVVVTVGTRNTITLTEPSMDVGPIMIRSMPLFWPALTTTLLVSVFTLPLLVAFIIPGAIAAVYWTFAVPEAVVLGHCRNLKAMAVSFRLVQNHWWEVVGRLLLIAAPIMIFTYVLYGITESIINNIFIAALVYTLSDIAFVFLMVYFVFYFYDLFKGLDSKAQRQLLLMQEEEKQSK